jgi:hypothetical protein
MPAYLFTPEMEAKTKPSPKTKSKPKIKTKIPESNLDGDGEYGVAPRRPSVHECGADRAVLTTTQAAKSTTKGNK